MKNFFKRPPDVTIGPEDDLYLMRWYLIPKNRILNIYLHKFLRSDDDRALHDHPWFSIGIIFVGEYDEIMPANMKLYRLNIDRTEICIRRRKWAITFRGSKHIHRIQLLADGEGRVTPVWTLFITGPKTRTWGFLCPKGFRKSKDFVEVRVGGNSIGRGCE